MKAVSVGDILIDFNPLGVDEFGYPSIQAQPGGDVGNFLAAMRKFGSEAEFIGKIGDDTFGHLLLKTLQENGIGTGGVVVSGDTFTTLGFVTLDASGDRDFSFMHAADVELAFDEINLSILENADVLHFSTVSMTDEPARTAIKKLVEYAKAKGILISFDPNLRKTLWADLDDCKAQMLWGLSVADVIKIGDEEIDFLFTLGPEAGAEKILSDTGASLVYATCGAKGCFYKSRHAGGFVPSLSGINVIDTVGAGDIFGGSAMWKLLSLGKPPAEVTAEELREVVSFATAAAGLSTTKHGGMTSVPSLEEIAKVKG